MKYIKLEFIDHVAIRATDIEKSAEWYELVLGMERHESPTWEPIPVILTSGDFGVALFPAAQEDEPCPPASRNSKLDHFAFRVGSESFEHARSYFKELEMEFQVQHHHYFESIYIKDPDGHTVELTTPVSLLHRIQGKELVK